MSTQDAPQESKSAVGTSAESWFGVGVDTWASRIHQAFGVAKENALAENEALSRSQSVASAETLAKVLADINSRLSALESAVEKSQRPSSVLAH